MTILDRCTISVRTVQSDMCKYLKGGGGAFLGTRTQIANLRILVLYILIERNEPSVRTLGMSIMQVLMFGTQ